MINVASGIILAIGVVGIVILILMGWLFIMGLFE